ncbi:MAG: Uma2 family endonuclease [Thiotrichales bacterium]|nr:Uma2 family endonuclease [Thiotrichales bacterium]
MNDRVTMHIGPLGSAIHVLRADAQTIERLAAIDWSRHFRRVCLDPARGLITLMSPSRLHEDLSRIFDDIVDEAADRLGRASKPLRSTRLRGRGEPPGTGMEPDCTFYVGERADGYQAARMAGEAAADAFLESTAPDLVVEVELTNADAGKVERYGQMGVRELWHLHGRKGSRELTADFLAFRSEGAPRPLDASQVLEGLTPADVCEAVEGVRSSRTRAERTAAVARIVRRRGAVRVREDEAPYATSPEAVSATAREA